MAALTDAMKWYNLGASGVTAPRLKYHFQVEFFTGSYQEQLSQESRLLFQRVRSIELPKFSVETEVVNAWNLRIPVPTKVNFEPISITFYDTIDNTFQTFIANYMNIISGNFQESTGVMRTGFDSFGMKLLESRKDSPIDKIVVTRFYGADADRENLEETSTVTIWRPKIIDVQHDTLDYSASEAVQWQISLRYESIEYSGVRPEAPKEEQLGSYEAAPVRSPEVDIPAEPRRWNWSTGNLEEGGGSDLPPSA